MLNVRVFKKINLIFPYTTERLIKASTKGNLVILKTLYFGIIRTRKIPNTDTFNAVDITKLNLFKLLKKCNAKKVAETIDISNNDT